MKKEDKTSVKSKAGGLRSPTLEKSEGRPKSVIANPDASDSLPQVLLDSTSLICAVWDESGRLTDCNLEMLRALKAKNKTDVMKPFFDFSPEYQYDGMLSKEKGMQFIELALKTGFYSFEWEYLSAENERILTETSLVRVKWNDGYHLLAYSRNLRELRKVKEQENMAEERMAMMLNRIENYAAIHDAHARDPVGA